MNIRTTLGMKARGRHQKKLWPWVIAVLLIAQSLTLCTCFPAGRGANPPISITVGAPVEVASETIGTGGGNITVDKQGDPLNGLSIEIPQGAFETPIEFTVSESPILEVKSQDEVTAMSPLITIENGAGYANQVIKVKVPVKASEGQFDMGFIYDPETQSFEGLPTFAEDDSSVTVLTRHFSPLCVLRAPKSLLDSIQRKTDFRPGKDTWNLENMGSYLAPGGFCKGMSLTSLYYFLYEKPITNEKLWKDEMDNGLPADMKTPDFWQDDKWAIQLCSAANSCKETESAGQVIQTYMAGLKELMGIHPSNADERTFYLTVFSLLLTGQPQLIGVWNTKTTPNQGHSLVCYEVSLHSLFVADPNYPDNEIRSLDYIKSNHAFLPYSSAESVADELAGKGIEYDEIDYEGTTCFYNLPALEQLWSAFKSGAIDSQFPHYDIWVNELDEEGNTLDIYRLDRANGHTTGTKFLKFQVDAPFEAQLKVYRYEDFTTAPSPDRVELHPGDNYLGFYVEGEKNKQWWWAGFDWVKIVLKESEKKESAPAIDMSSWTYCQIRVDFDAVLRDASTGEEHTQDRSVGITDLGHADTAKWSGNTFTASWTRRDESDTYEAPRGFYTEEVTISLTIDPQGQKVTEFSFLHTIKGDCGSIFSYGASGGECTKFHLSSSGAEFIHDAQPGGWTPQITWVETSPAECAVVRAYELVKATYRGTMILLEPCCPTGVQ